MRGPFDVFSGSMDNEPRWLETTGDIETAISRMEERARVKPGSYFVFSTYCYTVVATIDTKVGETHYAERRER